MRQRIAAYNPFVARWDQPPRFRVPFRQVWCDTLQSWVRQSIWCLIVLPLFWKEVDQVTCHCGSYGTPIDDAPDNRSL